MAGDQHIGAHHVTVLHEGPCEVGHAPEAVCIHADLRGMDVDLQHFHGRRVWCGVAYDAPAGLSRRRL